MCLESTISSCETTCGLKRQQWVTVFSDLRHEGTKKSSRGEQNINETIINPNVLFAAGGSTPALRRWTHNVSFGLWDVFYLFLSKVIACTSNNKKKNNVGGVFASSYDLLQLHHLFLSCYESGSEVWRGQNTFLCSSTGLHVHTHNNRVTKSKSNTAPMWLVTISFVSTQKKFEICPFLLGFQKNKI